jgi:hypothetical protein
VLALSNELKETLKESLYSYYTSISQGDLSKLSSLMTEESYIITISTLGFKKAFKDAHFKELLGEMENNAESLTKVQNILSQELKKESRKNSIEVISYELKGLERVTLHYKEDSHPKRIYFSKQNATWLIDLKAGRQKDI